MKTGKKSVGPGSSRFIFAQNEVKKIYFLYHKYMVELIIEIIDISLE